MLSPEYFSRLGFTPKETDVYQALYKIGPSPASTLARLTGIKRTSIYDILNTLLEKNLIISFRQNNYTYFAIDDINKLYLYEKGRLHVAEQLVRQLKEQQQYSQGIQVHYYRGLEGFREMYEDILRAKTKEICAWMNLDTFYTGLDPVREPNWTRERVQQKTYARLCMVDSPLTREFQKNDPENLRQTLLLPAERGFVTSCFIYGNNITFFDPSDNMSGIRIHNPALAMMQQGIFDREWAAYTK